MTTQELLDIDSFCMYGDTQNTGATRSQCSLDISTFRVSYKAMTHVFVSSPLLREETYFLTYDCACAKEALLMTVTNF